MGIRLQSPEAEESLRFEEGEAERPVVEEGARQPVRMALIGADGPTGTFSDEDGPVAW